MWWSECCVYLYVVISVFFFQAEDGIRDLVRSRGLGDVYKRQGQVAGIVTLIRQHGRVVDFDAYGLADTESGAPMLSLIHI